MVRIAFVFGLVLSLTGIGAGAAIAAELSDAAVDRLLKENPGYGVLIMDLMMRNEKGEQPKCGEIVVGFMDAEGTRAYIQSYMEPQPFGLGDGFSGGATIMKPGLYSLVGIRCRQPGINRDYNGRLATITIRSGEILAAGTLVVDYKDNGLFFGGRFSANSRAEDFRPVALASLKKRIPVTFSRAKRGLLVVLTNQQKQGAAAPKQ
jgi:hypothetical protein